MSKLSASWSSGHNESLHCLNTKQNRSNKQIHSYRSITNIVCVFRALRVSEWFSQAPFQKHKVLKDMIPQFQNQRLQGTPSNVAKFRKIHKSGQMWEVDTHSGWATASSSSPYVRYSVSRVSLCASVSVFCQSAWGGGDPTSPCLQLFWAFVHPPVNPAAK